MGYGLPSQFYSAVGSAFAPSLRDCESYIDAYPRTALRLFWAIVNTPSGRKSAGGFILPAGRQRRWTIDTMPRFLKVS